MASTLTAFTSEASPPPADSTTTAAPHVRRWGLYVALALALGGLLGCGALYAYLQHGWFESARLGQTLHLRRIHEEGLHYRTRRAFGLFPRAKGLLHESFTHNAWKITSADGYTLYQKPPSWWAVPLVQIPPAVRTVFVFREDRRFYQHAGVEYRALLRAGLKTLTGRKQGGSTIAMQVAKHCLLDYGATPASTGLRGLLRKGREMLLAWRLVKVEGRDKVLAYYLNHAAMGPGLRGIGPAALLPDHLLLSWNGQPTTPPTPVATPGLSQPLFRALQDAVAATAPHAVLPDSPLLLAAKTGTTDGGRDAWLVGFLVPIQHAPLASIVPRITFVVWAGYDDNRAAGLYGAIYTARFSAAFFRIGTCRRPGGLCCRKNVRT